MPGLDVFKGTAFSLLEMTDAISALPFKPQRIAQMGIFPAKPISTTSAFIEEKAGTLTLVQTVRRGGPAAPHGTGRRTARAFGVPRIPLTDQILADDLVDVRKFGSNAEHAGVQETVNEHLQAMVDNIAATIEYHRATALAGKVLDADATEIINWFDVFEVSEQTKNFAFTTDGTDIRGVLIAVKRVIETELGAIPFDHVHGFAGDDWWDAYIKHPDVKEAFALWQNGKQTQEDLRSGFTFAGVTIENYRGSVGGTAFINTALCRFFPMGTNLMKTIYAPAGFNETVGTLGLPLYAKQRILEFDTGIEILAESNPMPICMKPKTLVKGTKS